MSTSQRAFCAITLLVLIILLLIMWDVIETDKAISSEAAAYMRFISREDKETE